MLFTRPAARAATVGFRFHDLALSTQLLVLLAGHLLLWTWVGWSSRSNFDVPGDMVEAYAWAQGWQWGYYKHPPLSAWMAGLWFSVVPESHLGYSLLAAFNSTVGLAGLTVLAGRFMPPRWVLLAVAVASLAPGVTTLAMRFNANAVLLSTWPWAMALFVRLMEHGRTRDAIGCGVACALALLGKYYSGVLVLSLLATALCIPAWRGRLRTAPFLLSVTTAALCLAPHFSWLLVQTQGPLQYAHAATGTQSPGESLMRAVTFALAQCVFPLLAFLALRLALRGPARHRAFAYAVTAPLRARLEAPWLLAMLPVLATMAATVATGARTASVWGLAIAAGLAMLAVYRAREAGATLDLRRLWTVLGVVWMAVALLSPLWWTARAVLHTPAVADPREELAHAVARQWQLAHGSPLPAVSGTRALAASVAFYADAHPRYFSLWNMTVETPWVDSGDVIDSGGVIVCEPADQACHALAEAWTADRREITVAKQARGFRFEPQRYVVYTVPPAPLGVVP